MNKYIKTDLRDAVTSMKVAIMNALNDINKGEETYINLGKYISHLLFIECLRESSWKINEFLEEELNTESIIISPSGKEVVVNFGPEYILSATQTIEVTISMSLSSTQKIDVPGNFDVSNNKLLREEALAQVYTPEDALNDACYGDKWVIDEICVV